MNNKIIENFGITKKHNRDFLVHTVDSVSEKEYIDDVLISLHKNKLTERLYSTTPVNHINQAKTIAYNLMEHNTIRNNFRNYIFEKYNGIPSDGDLHMEIEHWFLSIYYHLDEFITVKDSPYLGKMPIPDDDEFVIKFS